MISLRYKNINIALLAVFGILEAVQLLIIVSFISYFVPIHVDPNIFIPEKPPEPTRAIFLYRFFVVAAILIFAASLFLKRKRIDAQELSLSLGKFLTGEIIFTTMMAFSFYKLVIWGVVPLAKEFFYISLASTVLFKIFWLARQPLHTTIARRVNQSRYLEYMIDMAMPLLIFALVYIPNRSGLFGRMLATDQLYHFDLFVMAPAWAYLKGCIINYDIFSQYGFGMPVVIAHLSRLVGGFSYENVLLVMAIMIMGYCLMFYLFVRFWLGDVFWSSIAVILFLQWQVFNNDQYMLLYPSRSAVRLLFDLPVFWLLLLHLRQPQRIYLIAASTLVGLGIIYVTDIGIYLYVTLVTYIVIHGLRQDTRKLLGSPPFIFLYLGLPFVIGTGALYLLVGKHVFNRIFLENTFSFFKDSAYGFGDIPFYHNLQPAHVHVVPFIMSCVVPFVYLLFLLNSAVHFLWNKVDRKIIFVLTLSVYGLSTFHYHVWRSIGINFYVMGGPFILLIVYALAEGVNWLNKESVKTIKIGLVFLSIFVLFSTPHVQWSPNVFNFTKQTFELNEKFIKYQLSIDKDIGLITRFTKPGDEVCLISSFETYTLMKADRKPFFLKVPIVKSTLFLDVDYHGLTVNTNHDIKKIITEMEIKAPRYIFIEKKIIRYALNHSAFVGPSLHLIARYVMENYEFLEDGRNLVVFRKVR